MTASFGVGKCLKNSNTVKVYFSYTCGKFFDISNILIDRKVHKTVSELFTGTFWITPRAFLSDMAKVHKI